MLFLSFWWRGRCKYGLSCMKYQYAILGGSEGSAVSDAREQKWNLLLSERWLCILPLCFCNEFLL